MTMGMNVSGGLIALVMKYLPYAIWIIIFLMPGLSWLKSLQLALE